jgi:SAM-dependent methyltransferase
MNNEQIRRDFDELANLVDDGASGADLYDNFLLSLVPPHTRDVLDVGCGMGRLTARIARTGARVTGIDLSPAMIERAVSMNGADNIRYVCGDVLAADLPLAVFDCVISAATFHHMPPEIALNRMTQLLRPGGRLIIHDIMIPASITDYVKLFIGLSHEAVRRFLRTGWPLSPRAVRKAWRRHSAAETYLTRAQADAFAQQSLPGANVYFHWLGRYTIVWHRLG